MTENILVVARGVGESVTLKGQSGKLLCGDRQLCNDGGCSYANLRDIKCNRNIYQNKCKLVKSE